MSAVVLGSHVLAGQVRVHLCRRDAGVAQEFLDMAEGRSPTQEMGGEAVTQSVRRDLAVYPGPLGVPFQSQPEALSRETAAPPAQEQGTAGALVREQ